MANPSAVPDKSANRPLRTPSVVGKMLAMNNPTTNSVADAAMVLSITSIAARPAAAPIVLPRRTGSGDTRISRRLLTMRPIMMATGNQESTRAAVTRSIENRPSRNVTCQSKIDCSVPT